MLIIAKHTQNDEIVAWDVAHPMDNGEDFIETIAANAIYSKIFFDEMINSGYIYHDYHGNVTKDGVPIIDVKESDIYLSDDDITELYDNVETSILDEKDICGYFKRDVNITFLETKPPINVTIKTREDFVNYIETMSKLYRKGGTKFIPFPVNRFANKEALFTLNDIVANKDRAKELLCKLYECHTLTTKDDYDELLNTYCSQQILQEGSPRSIMVNIIQQFLEYGVPGINANIVEVKIDLNPKATYANMRRSSDLGFKIRYGLRNNTGTVYSEDVNGVPYTSMNSNMDYDVSDNLISSCYGSDTTDIKVSENFHCIAYVDKFIPPRVNITMMNDDGLTVLFSADINGAHFIYNDTHIFDILRLFEFETIDSVRIPISDVIIKGFDYVNNSVLIRSFIKESLDSVVRKPKYSNSFELACGSGISPYFAPSFLAWKKKKNPSYPSLVDESTNIPMRREESHKIFMNGFSRDVIAEYGDKSEEFMSLDQREQCDIISMKVDDMLETGTFLEVPKGNRIAEFEAWANYDKQVSNVTEIDGIQYVYTVMDGMQSYGKLALGLIDDSRQDSSKLFGAIYGAYIFVKEKNPSITMEQFISSGMIEDIVDVSTILHKKDGAYFGAIYDECSYRATLAAQARTIFFVTKVIREFSNSPDVIRHYGFECITINDTFDPLPRSYTNIPSFRPLLYIRNEIIKIITKHLSNSVIKLSDVDFISYDLAVNAIYNIFFTGRNNLRHNEDSSIYYVDFKCVLPTVTYKVIDNEEIAIPASFISYMFDTGRGFFQRRYCTCYDFCYYQFDESNMNCIYYCVNANISPWYVFPRGTIKLNEYNFCWNYSTKSAMLNKVKSNEMLYNSIVSDKSCNFFERYDEKSNKALLAFDLMCLIENKGSPAIGMHARKKEIDNLMQTLYHSEAEKQNAINAITLTQKDAIAGITSKEEKLRNNLSRLLSFIKTRRFALSTSTFEDISTYYNGISSQIMLSKKVGKPLKYSILKSDVVFNKIKQYCFDDQIGDEEVYCEENDESIALNHLSSYQMRNVSANVNSRLSSGIDEVIKSNRHLSISRIQFSDIDLNTLVNCLDLCSSNFNQSNLVSVSFKSIIAGNIKVDLDKVSTSDTYELDKLVNAKYAIQIDSDTYIIRTIHGLVKVSV